METNSTQRVGEIWNIDTKLRPLQEQKNGIESLNAVWKIITYKEEHVHRATQAQM